MPSDPAARLPLRPVVLSALAALAGGPLSGIDVMERVNDALPSRPILGPGTLYRLLRELRQDGWIEAVVPPPGASDDDDRRQYHALTALGRAALDAEAGRLCRTLEAAGLLHSGGHGG